MRARMMSQYITTWDATTNIPHKGRIRLYVEAARCAWPLLLSVTHQRVRQNKVESR